MLFGLTMLAITLAAWFLGLIALVCAFFARRAERWTLVRSIGCFALPGIVMIGALQAAWRIRRTEFAALAERAQPLIEAIEQYERDHSRAPRSLPALVPDYVPAVPKTGHPRYPDFEYEPSPAGVTWALIVPCSLGFGNWDEFFYWPTEDYPEHTGAGSIERVGRWAYLHE